MVEVGVGYRPGAVGGRANLEEMADVDGTVETGENDAGADFRTAELASAYLAGTVSQHDLELAARAIHRWADLIRAAGRDY